MEVRLSCTLLSKLLLIFLKIISYEWYIPLKCDFGFLDNDGYSEVHEEIFYVNKKNCKCLALILYTF